MKVLFAIRDDNNIVDSIARKYQRDYNKKLLYKEVKNFTAILRELQQNNSYDRIVISDDIDEKINKSENKNKLILSRLNSIRKAAINKNNKSIPIIFISNNDKIKKQLFDLNIYNGILGEDKIKRKIYELMQAPRNSKKAKEYYNIQETPKAQSVQKTVSKSVNKQSDEKSEVEKAIKYLNQTDLSDEKYVKKFESAYSTLSKSDLDILIKSLSARTKKILSNNSTRYNKIADTKKENKTLNSKKTVNNEITETTEETTTKRGRGRPRKQPKEDELEQEPVVKRKRGRPRKVSLEEEQTIKKENQKEEQSKNVNKKPEKTINKTQKVSTKLEKAVNKTEEVDDKPEKVINKAEKVAVPSKKQSKVSKKEEKHDELDDLEDDDFDFELEDDLESTNATNNKLENDNYTTTIENVSKRYIVVYASIGNCSLCDYIDCKSNSQSTEQTETPKQDGNATKEPETPSQNENTTTEPEIPSQNESTTTEPEIPSQNENTTTEPEIPSQNENTTTEPEIPSQNENTTTDLEVPSQNEDIATKPETPSQDTSSETTNKKTSNRTVKNNTETPKVVDKDSINTDDFEEIQSIDKTKTASTSEANMPQTGENDTAKIAGIIVFSIIGMVSFYKYKESCKSESM